MLSQIGKQEYFNACQISFLIVTDMEDPDTKATILIVDDSAAIRLLINTCLCEGGYRVVEAVDGEAGLKACRA